MGKRNKHLQGLLGPLETDVMEMVWSLEDATVRDVHASLAARRDLAYTTIMTTMARLAAKGLLERDTSGLAHRYRPDGQSRGLCSINGHVRGRLAGAIVPRAGDELLRREDRRHNR